MGLNKSFQCIFLSVGSFYLEVCNFFFPCRWKFITSADANGCHMFLLAIRPQSYTNPLTLQPSWKWLHLEKWMMWIRKSSSQQRVVQQVGENAVLTKPGVILGKALNTCIALVCFLFVFLPVKEG